jgi:hypothetical protein
MAKIDSLQITKPPSNRVVTRFSNHAFFSAVTKKLLFVAPVLLLVALAAYAADITGKWTWEQAGRGGGAPMSRTLTLKSDGSKLTGSMPGFGPPGGDAPPAIEISNAKIDGNKISFEVKQSFGDNEFVTKYEGVLNGDELKLKIQRPGFNGADAPPPVEVTAKRDKT